MQLVEIDISHDNAADSPLAQQMLVDGWRYLCGLFTVTAEQAERNDVPPFMYEIEERYAVMNLSYKFNGMLVYLHEQMELAEDIFAILGNHEREYQEGE